MLSGDFAQKLKRLNRDLHINCGEDKKRPAMLSLYRYCHLIDICAIDKNYVPEFTEWAKDGSIVRGGWRRVINILLDRKLCDRKKAERLFYTHFDGREKLQKHRNIETDYILKAIEEAKQKSYAKTIQKYYKHKMTDQEKVVLNKKASKSMSKHDVVDIGREIQRVEPIED